MKKMILCLVAAFLATTVTSMAQDWADFTRYAKANEAITAPPVAVFMGDSITEGWYKTDPDFFENNNFIGRGISGQTSSHMLVRFRKDVIDLHPKYVVILAGTNDIAQNNGVISLDNILGNIISMCELAKLHKIKPVLCSLLPASSFWWRTGIKDSAQQIIALNKMIAEYAASAKIPYVDYHSSMSDEQGGLPKSIASDGVHPDMAGYKIMEPIILGNL